MEESSLPLNKKTAKWRFFYVGGASGTYGVSSETCADDSSGAGSVYPPVL